MLLTQAVSVKEDYLKGSQVPGYERHAHRQSVSYSPK
jgi:hypothetical protein